MQIRLKELKRLIREGLRVAAEVRPSSDKGSGLYASEFIPAGGLVFRWVDGYDQTYSLDHPSELSTDEREEFKRLASTDSNAWYLAGGDGAYFNHSSSPNVRVMKGDGPSATWDRVAVKNIEPGEELTMDYGEVGVDF
jgi:SET domain-containing protein